MQGAISPHLLFLTGVSMTESLQLCRRNELRFLLKGDIDFWEMLLAMSVLLGDLDCLTVTLMFFVFCKFFWYCRQASEGRCSSLVPWQVFIKSIALTQSSLIRIRIQEALSVSSLNLSYSSMRSSLRVWLSDFCFSSSTNIFYFCQVVILRCVSSPSRSLIRWSRPLLISLDILSSFSWSTTRQSSCSLIFWTQFSSFLTWLTSQISLLLV